MNTIVRKILESGLVDKHTVQLMERWGTLDKGSSELIGKEDLTKKTEQQLIRFVNEISDLLEEDKNTFKETRLDTVVKEITLYTSGNSFTAHLDEMDKVLVDLKYKDKLVVGKKVLRLLDLSKGRRGVILDVTTLYNGDEPDMLLVDIDWE